MQLCSFQVEQSDEDADEVFKKMDAMQEGIIGDYENIPEGQILTEEQFQSMNIDPSQFQMVR